MKEINVQFRGKPRYVIADPSLREFVLDCIGIIDYTRIRMDNAWIHGEWLYGKPLTKSLSNGYVKWHTNLYGAERIEARYFAYLDTKREKFKTKDFMTQSITINTVKKSNEHCERSIRYHYEKLNGKRFESLRNEYGCITKPLLKLVETCLPLVSVPHERLVA